MTDAINSSKVEPPSDWIEQYVVAAGPDGFESVLCASLAEARLQFLEIHEFTEIPADERAGLEGFFDDDDNWVFVDGERVSLDCRYEADRVSVMRVTRIRTAETPPAPTNLVARLRDYVNDVHDAPLRLDAADEIERLRHYADTCGGSDNDGRCPMRHLLQSETTCSIGDCEAVLAQHRDLVRTLDIYLNGDGAAKQASLCDIVVQCAALVRVKGSCIFDQATTQVPQDEARRLARALHKVVHALDDAEENAQTGAVTIEWNAETWKDINDALDSIGEQELCHERLHEIAKLPTTGVNQTQVKTI